MGFSDILSSLPNGVQLFLVLVGGAFLLAKVVNYFQFAINAFLLTGTNLRKYGKPGTWAVVTGASDGLGKEFASQLAAKGFNLVLVSRTQSKLDVLANELVQKHTAAGFQARTMSMDFARNNDDDYARLRTLVADLDVGILINNVGQSHSIPVPFMQTDPRELEDIVTINCLGTLKTTQAIVPAMQRRKRGLVLTMGSFAGWMPIPYLATYSGSKAFLQFWSTALAEEVKADGVDVHLVLSYLVTTAMSKIRRPNLLVPPPRPFVRAALSKIGTGGFQQVAHTYTPWWSHGLMVWFIENTIGAGHRIGLWFNLKSHVDIRQRALRKAEREAKKA